MVLLKNYSISMDYKRFIIIFINAERGIFEARSMATKNGGRHGL